MKCSLDISYFLEEISSLSHSIVFLYLFALITEKGFLISPFYSLELYKKDLNDPDNNDDMFTHLEPDILECEVKWALGSITTNKASRGDGIQLSYFKSLKIML